MVIGTAFSLVYLLPVWGDPASTSNIGRDIIAVLTVGISILIMVVTDTEHPPAAGTALGLVITDWTVATVLFVILGALILSTIHMLLRPRLQNLL